MKIIMIFFKKKKLEYIDSFGNSKIDHFDFHWLHNSVWLPWGLTAFPSTFCADDDE